MERRRDRDGRRLHPKDVRREGASAAAGCLGGSEFLGREASFRAHEREDGGRVVCEEGAERLACRVGHHGEHAGITGGEHRGERDGWRDFQKCVSATLLTGLDRGPAQPLDRRRCGLRYAAGRDQRHEPGAAELREFFHQPFLAIALGERHGERERQRWSRRRERRTDLEPYAVTADGRDPSRPGVAPTVEHDDRVAHLGAQHAGEVPGFVAHHFSLAGDGRRGKEEAFAHEGYKPAFSPALLVLTWLARAARLRGMIRDFWQLDAAPFDGSLEPATFYTGAAQEEALARLEWLVDERQRFALVVGAEGHGKSHLAAMAVRRLAGLGAETVLLSLGGLSPGDWLEMLLARLPLDAASRAEPLRSWQKLENRIRENTLMERTTALVFDDIDRASADSIDGIMRLIGAPEARFARVAVVATATPTGAAGLPSGLRERAAVRVGLEPWDSCDVTGFLVRSLTRVGGRDDLFTPEAAETLARFTGGVPRVVARLAHLALAAAAGDRLGRVDAATVERAWRELVPDAATPSKTHLVDDDSAEPVANPRVRVVRRLFG
jgi:type II secretory pathway predicted ATPase ExeA